MSPRRVDKEQALKGLEQYDERSAGKFSALLDLLERWNRKVNLTAVRDRHVMASLHIDDSLAAQPLFHVDFSANAGHDYIAPDYNVARREALTLASDELRAECIAALEGQGVDPGEITLETLLAIRVRGSDTSLDTRWTGSVRAGCRVKLSRATCCSL